MLECFSEPRPKTGLIRKRWCFAHIYSSAFVSSWTVSWTFGLGSLGANDTWPAGCGLSWLPFWVCNFLSKFYNGFLSWWWNLISLCTYLNESAGHGEISTEGETKPFSAGCGGTKDNLDIGMVLHSSDLLLLRRTFSFPLYFLEKSHVEISFAVVLMIVQESSFSRSLSSSRVFHFLCCSARVACVVSEKSCQWLSQLFWGSGVLQLTLSFTFVHTLLGTSQSFQKSLFPTTHSMVRSVVEMLMNLD